MSSLRERQIEALKSMLDLSPPSAGGLDAAEPTWKVGAQIKTEEERQIEALKSMLDLCPPSAGGLDAAEPTWKVGAQTKQQKTDGMKR